MAEQFTPDTLVRIGNLTLKNPVLTASGTFGYGEEFTDFMDLGSIGGFIVKGTTLNHREGNPYPRMVETPSGMLNAVGLQNKGVDYFIENIYSRITGFGSEPIVNVSGASVSDYVEVCRRLQDKCPLIKAIEVNISCPNVKQGGIRYHMRRRCRSDTRGKSSMERHTDSKIVTKCHRHSINSACR